MAWMLALLGGALVGFITAPLLDALWRASQETASTIEQTAPQMAQMITMMMYMMMFVVMVTIFSSIVSLVRGV